MFMRSNSLAVTALGTILAGSATASPMFVATSGQTLYRFDLSGNVESFDLGREFNGAATDSEGRIWLTEKQDIDGDGFRALERIDNALAPNVSLTHMGDFLDGPSATITFIDDRLIAFQNVGLPQRRMVTVDPVAQTNTPVGSTGLIVTRAKSLAFDPGTRTLYGSETVGSDANSLLIDHAVTALEDPSQTVLGPLGVIERSAGGEWLDGSYYHAAIFENQTGMFDLRIGTIDLQSGQWSEIMTIASNIENGAVSLATVPAPASAGVLALGGVLAGRRRR